MYSKFKFYDPHTILYSFGNHIHYLLFFFLFFIYFIIQQVRLEFEFRYFLQSYRKNLINTESQHFWKKNHILLYMLSFLHAWFWQYNEKIIEGFIALEVIKVNLIMWNFLTMLHCYTVNLIMCNFLPKLT